LFERYRCQHGGLKQLGIAHVDVCHVDTMALEPFVTIFCLLLIFEVHKVI
jgi:hypothetical protein